MSDELTPATQAAKEEIQSEFIVASLRELARQLVDAPTAMLDKISYDMGVTGHTEEEIPYGHKTHRVPPNHLYFVVNGPFSHFCEIVKTPRTGKNAKDALRLAQEVERARRVRQGGSELMTTWT